MLLAAAVQRLWLKLVSAQQGLAAAPDKVAGWLEGTIPIPIPRQASNTMPGLFQPHPLTTATPQPEGSIRMCCGCLLQAARPPMGTFCLVVTQLCQLSSARSRAMGTAPQGHHLPMAPAALCHLPTPQHPHPWSPKLHPSRMHRGHVGVPGLR